MGAAAPSCAARAGPGSASRCRPRRQSHAGATASTSTCWTHARSPMSFGAFDAVASLGAFEHFCSAEDYRAGRQEEIYRRLFARVAGLLPAGGRFYLQTMAFGPRMIPIDEVDLGAPRGSDAWYLALMGRQFPARSCPSARIRSSRQPCRRSGWSRAPAAARLHRDDPPVAQAVRRAEREGDAAQAPKLPRRRSEELGPRLARFIHAAALLLRAVTAIGHHLDRVREGTDAEPSGSVQSGR